MNRIDLIRGRIKPQGPSLVELQRQRVADLVENSNGVYVQPTLEKKAAGYALDRLIVGWYNLAYPPRKREAARQSAPMTQAKQLEQPR